MSSINSGMAEACRFIPGEDLPSIFQALVLQSPISTWIADKNGTNIFENEACRNLLGIERDADVVGKYNIFKDEQLAAQGVMPQIRKVFDEGGSVEIIVDYDSGKIQQFSISRPTHKILRGFLFAITDESGAVRYVVVQHEDYTARYRAEKSLAESESRYRQLVEEISDWVWAVDTEGRYTYSSPVVESLLGYKVEDVIGKSTFDFIVPEDQEISRKVFEEAVREQKPIEGHSNRIRRKDGSVRYFETSGKPIFNEQGSLVGFRGVDRDITDRVLGEIQLRRSEKNLRDLVANMPAAIFAFDRQGTIILVNHVFEVWFGYSRDDIVGRSVFETIISPEIKTETEEVIEKVFDGETIEGIEWKYTRPDNTVMWFLTNKTPIFDAAGGVTMGLSLNIDITERKKIEQSRLELEEHKKDFYRRTILAATEGKLEITERDEIFKIAGPAIASWTIKYAQDIGRVRRAIVDIAKSVGMEQSRIDDFILAFGEAATNAYKHAGGGDVSLHEVNGALMFIISDTGKGISALSLPEVAMKKGYSTAGSLGMGYKTILSLADKVYLDTGEGGTTVAVCMGPHATAPQSLIDLVASWTI